MKISQLVVALKTDKATLLGSVWLVNKDKPRQSILLADAIAEGEAMGIAESLRAQLGHTLIGQALSPGIQMGG